MFPQSVSNAREGGVAEVMVMRYQQHLGYTI